MNPRHAIYTITQVLPSSQISSIDDADEQNGSLIVVPESHHELICHGSTDPKVSFAPKGLPMRDDGIQSRLKKGDVLFFDGGVINGSLANTTTDRFRRALIYHYIPQTSKEIAIFYQPLVHPSGHSVDIDMSAEGNYAEARRCSSWMLGGFPLDR